MVKFKHYITNALISSLIGAVVGLSHALIRHPGSIEFSDIITGMAIGVLIGSTSMAATSRMMMHTARKPLQVYAANLLIVAVIFGIISFYFSKSINFITSPVFLLCLILAEMLSCMLIFFWYRYTRTLNGQLAKKKSELE